MFQNSPVCRNLLCAAEQLLFEYDKKAGKKETQSHLQNQSEIEKKLSEIDTDALSPVEALMKLYELKKLLKDKPELIRAAS